MRQFTYPVTLTPEIDGRGFTVTFADLPEAITCGGDEREALVMASDCLEEALAGRIADGENIPMPSKGRVRVAPGAVMAAKTALYTSLRESGISRSDLARRLDCDPREVRRMLDPRYGTKLPAIEKALAALGKLLVIEVRDAA